MVGALLLLAQCACSHAGAGARVPGRAPPPNIRLEGDAAFVAQARSALERLGRTAAGGRLLGGIERAGRALTLRFGRLDYAGALSLPVGEGDSVVVWDPDRDLPDFPALLGLHHELVHALYEARREALGPPDEEARAVGVGAYASSDVSENALRRELGLPLRTDHASVEEWLKSRPSRPARE